MEKELDGFRVTAAKSRSPSRHDAPRSDLQSRRGFVKIDATVIGGGMIVHDQILPSLYHLQRLEVVGQIHVVAASSARLRNLVNERFAKAFPGQSFAATPDLSADPTQRDPDCYKRIVQSMQPHQLVIVAT